MPDLGVTLTPLDPMLFGDNRSARAGEDHALADQDPTPPTLYGAIGARIAAVLGGRGPDGWDQVCGPVLGPWSPHLGDRPAARAELLGYCLCDGAGQPWFPAPRSLRVQKAGAVPLELVEPVPPEDGIVTSLGDSWRLAGKEESTSGEELESGAWVSEELLAAALTGGDPRQAGARPVARDRDFYRADVRAGLTLSNATNAAVEGRLFGRPYRRFLGGPGAAGGTGAGAGFRAWYRVLSLPDQASRAWSGVGFLGGDRGRAQLVFEPEDPPLARLRSRVLARAGGAAGGYLLYLLTPATARNEALCPRTGSVPTAVAAGKPIHISGWSAAAKPSGPRPVRTLLPAGSVLFYRWPRGDGAAGRQELIEDLWLASLDGSLGDAGFGRVLPGVWGVER